MSISMGNKGALGEGDRHEREYSRVDAFLPLHVRLVPPEEQHNLWSRASREILSIRNIPLPELRDEALYECLTIINNKIDAILNMLNLEKSGINVLTPSSINISGNGMSFEWPERYSPKDILELKITLPTCPELVFFIYAEVVRCVPGECCNNRISVTYTLIDEDVREKIVKFVFERQREIIRNQRRQ